MRATQHKMGLFVLYVSALPQKMRLATSRGPKSLLFYSIGGY